MAIETIAKWTLHAACFIFFAAFASLYYQVPGLYGPNGLLPIDNIVSQAKSWSLTEMSANPTLLVYSNLVGFTVSEAMEILNLLGIVVSGLMILTSEFRNFLGFLILYVLYLSVFKVGQTFLSFQWDIMLLEFGVLCVITSISSEQGILLNRWLLLRLLFHSGYKKLESGCPTWWGMTALDWHFESQCIPTPLAYHAHHLPKIFLKFGVLTTYVSQMGIVLLVLSPNRRLRIFSGWVHILHQAGILVTGNYNFFNLLTMLLGFTCFDDEHIKQTVTKSTKLKTWKSAGRTCFELLQICVLLFGISKCFKVDFEKKDIFLLDTAKDQTKLRIIRDCVLIPSSIIAGMWLLISIFSKRKFSKILVGCLSLAVFGSSLHHFFDIDRHLQSQIDPWSKQIRSLDQKFVLTNSYGLFRRMTGVGGRPEVVVEIEVNGKFQELEFPYKPTSLNKSCPWCIPHQPRLDWQMWFAALGRYEHNPWLLNLAVRLLQGSHDVHHLFDSKKSIPKPTAIRMWKYTYSYTDVGSNNIWSRKDRTEYLPTLTLNHDGFSRYIQENHLQSKKVQPRKYLKLIRGYILQVSPEEFIWINVCGLLIIRAATARYF